MKVYWTYNNKQYSGELLQRMEVVAEAEAIDMAEGRPLKWKDVKKYSYDIEGDDGKSYSVDEEDLSFEPIKL